jgi:hypothetical protein
MAGEELRRLQEGSPGRNQAHAQYSVALFNDTSLVVVPGKPRSHRRARMEGERETVRLRGDCRGEGHAVKARDA